MSEHWKEAFPNAEELLLAAYSLKNPYPELLRLVRAHASYRTVEQLAFYYHDVAEENPRRAELLTTTLIRIRDAPTAPGPDALDGYSMGAIINRKLADLHSRTLTIDEDDPTLVPSNLFLIASYLSALSFKYRLTSSPDMFGAIQNGLDTIGTSEYAQTYVAGALVQLLLHGSYIAASGTPSYWAGASDIAKKLTAHKKRGIFKDKHFGHLLDLTIANAEEGFKADVPDAWERIFPFNGRSVK